MQNNFYKALSLLVVRAIESSALDYTNNRKLREIKAELRVLGNFSLAGANRVVKSKYFAIIPGKASFTLKPLSGGHTLLINQDNISFINGWIAQAPKPTNLTDWKNKYGK